jgi:hypothetical protein
MALTQLSIQTIGSSNKAETINPYGFEMGLLFCDVRSEAMAYCEVSFSS